VPTTKKIPVIKSKLNTNVENENGVVNNFPDIFGEAFLIVGEKSLSRYQNACKN